MIFDNKSHPIIGIFRGSLVDLPSPSSLSVAWNFGSILGMCLSVQLITGLFLAMHYSADTEYAFSSVSHISRDVNFGWLLRFAHANGASMFFVFIFLHVGRGIYYGSPKMKLTWFIGVLLFLMVMAAGFMGYVLPWGQMSFWGATVITNLFSAIPSVGSLIVAWIWGGFSVDSATLTRFFAFHFLIPFLVVGLTLVHLLSLHNSGSSNPLGVPLHSDKVPFHPYYVFKDLTGFIWTAMVFGGLLLGYPWLLGDPENFIPANPMVTPEHIQPEWYFLFAYAILRSIPNKLGGVIALLMAVAILLVLSLFSGIKFSGNVFYYLNKLLFWFMVNLVLLLTWIGARPVEEPYVKTGQVLTLMYFSFYFSDVVLKLSWDSLLD